MLDFFCVLGNVDDANDLNLLLCNYGENESICFCYVRMRISFNGVSDRSFKNDTFEIISMKKMKNNVFFFLEREKIHRNLLQIIFKWYKKFARKCDVVCFPPLVSKISIEVAFLC